MDFQEYLQTVGAWLLTSGLQILLIFIMLMVALKVSDLLSKRLIAVVFRNKVQVDVEFQKRADTLKQIVKTTLTVVLIAVALIMILGELGIEIGPVLAAAGVIGIAVGFGAQKLVEDVISGFFILLDDQIRVGDVVEIAGKGGLVERVDLRMVTLRDLAGNVHFVRNGQIDVVTNMTKEYSRYVFEIGVAYREDVDEVIRIIQEVDENLRSDAAFKDDILEPIEILGLDEFGDSAIIIKARTKTKPIMQWRVKREFNRRLKKTFDERNIEIPFPHMTLYAGEPKEGHAPPIRVAFEGNGQAALSGAESRGGKESR